MSKKKSNNKKNKVYKKVYSCDWKGYEYEFQRQDMFKQDEKLTLTRMKKKGVTEDNRHYKMHCKLADKYADMAHYMVEYLAYASYCGITA